MGRLRRRYKQLLDGHKEKGRSWNLKEEAVAALYRELILKEAMDLSQDRLGNE